VFDAAGRGDAAAAAVLAEQADTLARGVLAVQSVLDPALVVLGGGIGSRADVVASVAARLRLLTARPPVVRASALGERAGVVGAVAAALAGVAPRERVDG
jgi:predicted NBD/HSP70 family sugar kinase